MTPPRGTEAHEHDPTSDQPLWERVWESRRALMAPRSSYAIDPYRIVERRFTPDYIPQTETLFTLSNGFLGVRGSVEEVRPVHSRASFMNGFHETWPITYGEEAFGFAKVGQTIVPVPDGTLIKLYVDDEPFEVTRAEVLEWERVFDMRRGVLERTVVWRMPTGKRLRLRTRRIVSVEHRHLMLNDYEVEVLDEPALLTISSELVNHRHDAGAATDDPRQARRFEGDVLVPVDFALGEDRAVFSLRTAHSGMTVAVGMQHEVRSAGHTEQRLEGAVDHARFVLRVEAEPKQPVAITKYVSYHMSERTASDELCFRVGLTLDRAVQVGRDAIATQHEQRVAEFWDGADVVVEGAPELQQAIRFSLFQVFQASARGDNHGIPAKGLTGTGYEGHYFWDTEIYVLPMLTYTMPKVAENVLQFRARMLDAARERAREVGHRGALYPWRTIDGREASAYYAAGTAQYHINADIMFGLQKYVRATGDLQLLTGKGAEMLVETARLWYDLGFFSDRRDGRFCINGVTGPDEYTTVVNNNLYTNLMARDNLLAASDVVGWLRERHPEEYEVLVRRTRLTADEEAAWREAGHLMYVPFDEQAQVHLQDDDFLEREVWDFAGTPPDKYPLLLHFHPLEIYRHQVIKQADVVLATFLLGWNFTHEEKRRIFEYYDPLTTGDSSLSACIQSVMAAELGLMSKACEYFADAVLVDLVDLAGNVRDGLHIASAGGVWVALVYGFGGLRDHWGDLHFQPVIPDGWTRLSFRVRRRNAVIEVDIADDAVTYRLLDGPPTVIYHWDQPVQLEAGSAESRPHPSREDVPRLAPDELEAPPEMFIA
ncbi:MAG: glycosyl hydrolase family 65 protein [Acidimicrobiales bacterium]